MSPLERGECRDPGGSGAVAHVPMASRSETLFGLYFSATQSDHVLYESRLELARLLLADFDTAVDGIVAKPFLVVANVDGKQRKHIPAIC
jgi:hypothetical protein